MQLTPVEYLALTKTSDGRQQISEAMPDLLRAVKIHMEFASERGGDEVLAPTSQNTLIMRAVRNMCASELIKGTPWDVANCLAEVSTLVGAAYARQDCKVEDELHCLAGACAQAIANLTVREATAGAAFKACWPGASSALLVGSDEGAAEALCQAIHNWARHKRTWAGEIATTGAVLTRLLRICCGAPGGSPLLHTAAMAMGTLCLSLCLMPRVLWATALALESGQRRAAEKCAELTGWRGERPADAGAAVPSPISEEVVCLLHLLQFAEGEADVALLASGAEADAEGVSETLGELARSLRWSYVVAQEAIKAGQGASLPADCMDAVLQLLAGILRREALVAQGVDIRAMLGTALGLAEFLVSVLADLGPPKRARDATSTAASTSSQPIPFEYPNMRSAILSVLGNLVYRQQELQDLVASLGGLELVLANCVFDPGNPCAREWGLWAVRNLCEGNERVQQRIADIRVEASFQGAELREHGQRVELNRGTGRFELVPDL